MIVTLSWWELAAASEVGRMRQLAAVRAGRPDRHGFKGPGWDVHIEGAAGEMAVAKGLGLYWDASVDTFKGSPDLPGIQVRTRSRDDYDLIVRPDDPDNEVFVLVTGRSPTFWLRGWINGREAKQEQWKRTYGGRPGAFFVPVSALHPVNNLGVTNAA